MSVRVLLHGKFITPLKTLVQRESIITGSSSERENLPSNKGHELTSLRAENKTRFEIVHASNPAPIFDSLSFYLQGLDKARYILRNKRKCHETVGVA